MSQNAVDQKVILLCAGGTGGHLFPAEALSHILQRRGAVVHLATDIRAKKYATDFPAVAVHAVPSATPTGGSVFAKFFAAIALARGVLTSRGVLRRIKPNCVVGFGGYPTVPPMLAAQNKKIPTVLHEQNAVMGRANAFLARQSTAIGTGFPDVKGIGKTLRAKSRFVGNPLRPNVIAAAAVPLPDISGKLCILITGGSQGARVFSDIVPEALKLMTPEMRAQLKIVQQVRAEDLERVNIVYNALGIQAETAPFFADLPMRMARAHLVVARSGASTVSELAAIGRPAILVPLPGAIDQDQAANAAVLAQTGAADVIQQSDFTARYLCDTLTALIIDPSDLTLRAEAAKTAGILDAAERLADLVLSTAN